MRVFVSGAGGFIGRALSERLSAEAVAVSGVDLAADAAVNAGFGSAGERCMAISALVVVEPVADELIAKITDAIPYSYIAYGASKAALNYITKKLDQETPDLIAFPVQ